MYHCLQAWLVAYILPRYPIESYRFKSYPTINYYPLPTSLPHPQKTKYPCPNGNVSAGSALNTFPSASTVYASGSTFIFGMRSFHFISFFPMFLQFFTASIRFFSPYSDILPDVMLAALTKVMDVEGTRGANIGRMITGCTVGMEALGSPCHIWYLFV